MCCFIDCVWRLKMPEAKALFRNGKLILYLTFGVLFYCECIAGTNMQKTIEMGAHKVTIMAKCPSDKVTNIINEKTRETLYAYSCNNIKITIQNEMLFVNGKYYGDLQATDSITLNKGKVVINGKEWQVKNFPQEKIMAKLRPKKTKEVISGYNVIFIPGFQGFKRSFSNRGETLDNGRVKVTIENDKLTVNGRDCGKLVKGDTVLIQDNEVIVSGRMR